jgi:glutathione synthase/RimK-type ligase-like ATP-grasp enzyme
MTELIWQQPADTPLGVAKLAKLAFDGADLGPLRSQLLDKYIYEPNNAAALMDLSTIEQLLGNEADGLYRLEEALQIRRAFHSPCAETRPSLRLLALAAPGDVGNNTPLEFLLEGSDVALTTLFVDPDAPPKELPPHDLAIVSACESETNRPVLDAIARLIPSWPTPVLNHPDRIAHLERTRLAARAAAIPGLVIPPTLRVARETLDNIAASRTPLATVLPDHSFPVIARPLGSHAGRGLKKLDDAAGLAAYLQERPEREFYLAPHIDYASADGLYRKYRIAFIGGRPYPCHLAIADQWMIYYLNAGMHESAVKRAEEEHFLHCFDREFGARHRVALTALAQRVGLDYFGIDCAETPSGELLLFEADVAMIVHLMDAPAAFAYKIEPMKKLFAAFAAMLKSRVALSYCMSADHGA